MPANRAELSSIASTLDQLAQRVGAMGEASRAAKEEDVANELFTVERTLSGAQRRLARMLERTR